jgi:hypothetical protein
VQCSAQALAVAADCVRDEQLAGELHALLVSASGGADLLTLLARLCSRVLGCSRLQHKHVVLEHADLLVKRDKLHAALQRRPAPAAHQQPPAQPCSHQEQHRAMQHR